MRLSKGMINNLWHSIMWFMCENCGPEQKQACEEIDECKLKLWLEEQESEGKSMIEKTCRTCRRYEVYEQSGCEWCIEHGKWEPKEIINGVATDETTTNEKGGKQSKLEYRFDLIDPKALFAIAKVFYAGAQKYEPDNWRKISVNDHLNHALSHIYAYLAGDEQDDHLEHAATRLVMALGVRKDV